jgi:hypothetical protein
MVLLLLRKPPLVLVLMLALMLVTLRVTLLELLGWVAWVAGTTSTLGLRSTNLAFHVIHLSALPFSHDCSVDQVLEGGESVIHQLVVKTVNQSSQKTVLPLSIPVDIFWGVTWQLQKFVPILTDRQGTLLQGEKLLLPHYHQSLGHMVAMEVIPELL